MAAANITAERLRSLVHYDPETGIFTNIFPRPKIQVGSQAGCIDPSTGYIKIGLDLSKFYAHRLAFLYMQGSMPVWTVDHINGVRSDNRWTNLRDVPHQVNLQNRLKASCDSRSGKLGVKAERGRWSATIYVDGKNMRVGAFDSPEEAHQAYLQAKRIHHPGCTI